MQKLILWCLFCFFSLSAAAQTRPYARANWTAELSSVAHNVSGKVTMVDERTILLEGFHYDGLGPRVFAYLGASDTNTAYRTGRSIGAQITQAYVNGQLILQLPQGETLDGWNALSIWCVEFRVSFGSGQFAPPVNTLGPQEQADAVFDWAQKTYPDLFAPAASSVHLEGYYLRYFSSTQSYLGAQDGVLWYLSSATGLLRVGLVSDFYAMSLKP